VAKKDVPLNAGSGVCGALGVAFVVLRLGGVLDWSWWWVLAPFWIPGVAALAIALAILAASAGGAKGPPAARTGATAPPREPEHEPVHVWTKRQLREYLERNPGYRPVYEAHLTKHPSRSGYCHTRT
jgi:hypothetical protein